MTDQGFTPVLFVKEKCPFSLKARLFLLEAGLLDQVEVREFAPGTPEEDAVRAELEPNLEKVTFPALKAAPGRYMADSDGIVAHFAQRSNTDPQSLPVFNMYVTGPFQSLMSLYRENMELKKKLA